MLSGTCILNSIFQCGRHSWTQIGIRNIYIWKTTTISDTSWNDIWIYLSTKGQKSCIGGFLCGVDTCSCDRYKVVFIITILNGLISIFPWSRFVTRFVVAWNIYNMNINNSSYFINSHRKFMIYIGYSKSFSRRRELYCCYAATGSLIHKNENLTGSDGYVFK